MQGKDKIHPMIRILSEDLDTYSSAVQWSGQNRRQPPVHNMVGG